MKSLDEIYEKVLEHEQKRGINYNKLVVQALNWARLRINHDPVEAENLILNRIAQLQLKQVSKEIMGFATKPARAKQINALRWVIDEGGL